MAGSVAAAKERLDDLRTTMRRQPSLRLVVSFAVGLVAGFIPAAGYVAGVQEDEIRPLRVQEVTLLT